MTLLFALLSMLALAGALSLSATLATPGGRIMAIRELRAFAVPTAAVVATVAMFGSLWLSEVEGFVPCRLCWVQRGFMYPLAIFLIVAGVTRWSWAARIALPVSVVGGAVSLYHYAEQQAWIGGSGAFCSAASPCTDVWVQHFGFISIPFMALMGFSFVAALMWLQLAARRADERN